MNKTVAMRIRSFALLAPLGLYGCATSMQECDPAQGGFFRGVGCSASGAYGDRQEQRYASLRQERMQQDVLRKEYSDVLQEQEDTSAQRAALQGQYAALQRDLRSLQASLRTSRSSSTSLEQQVSRLQAAATKGQAGASASNAESAARLKELQQQRDALEREIEIALGR